MVRCVLFVAYCLFVFFRLSFVASCLRCAYRCSLLVACCLLYDMCCSLFVVGWKVWLAVCGLMFDV